MALSYFSASEFFQLKDSALDLGIIELPQDTVI